MSKRMVTVSPTIEAASYLAIAWGVWVMRQLCKLNGLRMWEEELVILFNFVLLCVGHYLLLKWQNKEAA